MNKNYHYVYRTTNKINGKIYIGVRSSEVEPELDITYKGSGSYFLSAIKRHGFKNFSKEILQTFETRELANLKEAELVNFDFIERDDNYNLRQGGLNGLMSQETKSIISKVLKGRKAWNKGIPRTDEEKLKMSKSHTGQTSPFKGKSHSAESLAKLSNKIVTQEMKSKMSKSCKNQTRHTCPHCNILTTAGNYKRWHGDNCKFILL